MMSATRNLENELVRALGVGDPQKVAALIEAGADIHYKRPEGYYALLDALHDRDISRDPRLIDLLKLLIAHNIDLNGVTTYHESGLRVLSRIGRFDAVQVLLDAGADRSQLGWTPLIEAVALGSVVDVKRAVETAAPLEAKDCWSRTAWLVALLTGDLTKAEVLLAHGVNPTACGQCDQPTVFYAIEGHHPDVLRWLLTIGADIHQTDDFGTTALIEAVQSDDLECVELLIEAGAEIDRDYHGTALSRANSRAVAMRLLDAGADPANLSDEGRRAILGLPPEANVELITAGPGDFRRAYTRSFGTKNPEQMNWPFWQSMIRAGVSAYTAGQRFGESSDTLGNPIWCARRFGQSLTFLPDGRIVQIGGEHEDSYDDDFCIYNDVFVHDRDGTISIFGYPESEFPPTDFHTATLIGEFIYIVGGLGYQGSRLYGETPVYRLDIRTWRIDRINAAGDAPGWIYRHRAEVAGNCEIRIWGGMITNQEGDKEVEQPNPDTFVFDIKHSKWRRSN